MSAPTLPKELQAAIDIAEGRRQQIVNSTQVLSYVQVESCVWRTIKDEVAKLTEQLAASERERDEAREQRQEFSQRLHRTAQILVEEFGADRPSNADEVAQRAVERYNELRQQLAASKRTCAELREDLATVSVMRSGLIQKVEALIARAEAAGRTVEGIEEMRLCESERLVLRPNTLYRFTAAPGCTSCAAMVELSDLADKVTDESPATELVRLKGDGGE